MRSSKDETSEETQDPPARTHNTFLPWPRLRRSGDNPTCSEEQYLDGDSEKRVEMKCGPRTVVTNINHEDYIDPDFSANIDDELFSLASDAVATLMMISCCEGNSFLCRVCYCL